MKDLKSLKPTEIAIRVTEENAEFIIPLLEKLGGVGADYLKDITDKIGCYFIIMNNKDNWIVWITDEEKEELTEITLEQLRELAGVKEPQTDEPEIESDFDFVMPLPKSGKDYTLKCMRIEDFEKRESELTKLKSENESLKECLKDVKDHFSDGDENTLEALLIKIDTLLK